MMRTLDYTIIFLYCIGTVMLALWFFGVGGEYGNTFFYYVGLILCGIGIGFTLGGGFRIR